MKSVLKWIAIGFVVTVLKLIIDPPKTYEDRAVEEAVKNATRELMSLPIVPLPYVSASSLAREYTENTVAADQRYKGKKFKVTGTVADIAVIFENTHITLHGGVNKSIFIPIFSLKYGASLKKGTEITMVCTGHGYGSNMIGTQIPIISICSLM